MNLFKKIAARETAAEETKTGKTPEEKLRGGKGGIFQALGLGRKNRPAPFSLPASPDMPVLKLVVFIIDWKAARSITEIFADNHVRFHFICKGRGTASSEILDLLGIGSSDKAVVLCLEQDKMAPLLIREVNRELGLYSHATGIAFTVPLSGINKPILKVFKESVDKHISAIGPADKVKKEKKPKKTEDSMSAEKKFDLIMIIVNQGYTDELMAAARDAGATGGTVFNARGLVHKGPVKFFGISVQDEREIITIIADREKKAAIMHAVSESFGITSKAKGIVFSLPAENVTGLGNG